MSKNFFLTCLNILYFVIYIFNLVFLINAVDEIEI